MSSQSFFSLMSLPPRSLTYAGFFSTPRRIISARPTGHGQHFPKARLGHVCIHLMSCCACLSLFMARNASHSGSEPLYGSCLTSFVVKGNGRNSNGSSSSVMFSISSFSFSDSDSHSWSAQSSRGSNTTVANICQHTKNVSAVNATRLRYPSASLYVVDSKALAYPTRRPIVEAVDLPACLAK